MILKEVLQSLLALRRNAQEATDHVAMEGSANEQ
jgi:hypothetical protein